MAEIAVGVADHAGKTLDRDPSAATNSDDERLAEFRRIQDETDARTRRWQADLA